MRNHILLAVLLTPAAFAGVTVSADQVTPVSVRMSAEITAAGNIRGAYEIYNGTACRAANQLAYASMQVWRGGAGTAQRTIGGLKPGTTYCLAAWNQNTGEYSSVIQVQTLPLAAKRPEYPIPPTETPTPAMPVINGTTFTVAANCADLQNKLNAAGALNNALNHQVVIPAGTVCSAPWYLFPQRTGTGWIVVRTSTPDSQLPPEGSRMTPPWYSKLATIQVTEKAYLGASSAIRMTDDTSKWRFVGINITHRRDCSNCVPIATVTPGNPTRIVTSAPHGLANDLLIRAFGVSGITGIDKTVRVNVVDSTTITVPLTTTGTYTGGGNLIANTSDIQNYKALIYVSHGSRDVIFDRCWIHGYGFPERIYAGALIRGTRVSIVNSTIDYIRSWHLVEDGTNNIQFGTYFTNLVVDFTDAKQFKLENNDIEALGVALFAQDSNARVTEDVVLRRNHIVVSDEVRYRSDGANPKMDGHYYIHRMPFEVKQVKRLLIEGNVFEGQYTDNSPPGPGVLLYLRGSLQGADGPNGVQDALVRDNIFRNSSGAIQVVGEDDIPQQGGLGTRKLTFQNNLIYDIDAGIYKTTANSGSGNRGFCFWMMRSIHELRIDHNTCWDPRGSGPMSFLMGHNRSGQMELSNNIFGWNTDSNIGGFFYDDSGSAPLPSPPIGLPTSAAAFKQMMDGNWQQNPDPAWSMHDNLIVPGGRNYASSYDSTSLGEQWNWYSLCDPVNGILKEVLPFRNYCIGSNTANTGTETVRQRMAAVGFRDLANKDFRLLPSSPYAASGVRRASDGRALGADIDRINAQRGVVSNVRVRNLDTGSATISYQGPDAVACQVEYGTSGSYGTGVRLNDGGGAQARNVGLSGLTSNTTYYYRVLCSAEQPNGSFKTF